jgi:microcompartment protein CcmL/EutN
MPKALGLVETRGLVAAIEAADAMVKTSNVELIGKEVTRPALVTIKIVGDVAAVKASVDAGAAAASKVGELVSIHVIPQPDSQMVSLLPEIKDDDVKKVSRVKTPEKAEIKKAEAVVPQAKKKESPVKHEKKTRDVKKESGAPESPAPETGEKEKSAGTEKVFTDTTDHLERLRREALGIKGTKEEPEQKKKTVLPVSKLSMEDLEKLNVHQLRKQARATDGFPIQGRAISKANRNELLDYFKKLI